MRFVHACECQIESHLSLTLKADTAYEIHARRNFAEWCFRLMLTDALLYEDAWNLKLVCVE